jgi:hypothetical protein
MDVSPVHPKVNPATRRGVVLKRLLVLADRRASLLGLSQLLSRWAESSPLSSWANVVHQRALSSRSTIWSFGKEIPTPTCRRMVSPDKNDSNRVGRIPDRKLAISPWIESDVGARLG